MSIHSDAQDNKDSATMLLSVAISTTVFWITCAISWALLEYGWLSGLGIGLLGSLLAFAATIAAVFGVRAICAQRREHQASANNAPELR